LAVNVTLPTSAAVPLLLSAGSALSRDAVQQLLDICCLQGAQQQTYRMPILLSIDGTDR